MKKIYVGNLPFSFNEVELRELFAQFGKVVSGRIVIDKFTNKSKGYGFVEMGTIDEATRACAGLHGTTIESRSLTVSIARSGVAAPDEHSTAKPSDSSVQSYRTPMPHGMVGIGDRVAALREDLSS
jgi:RNA recognition motif-containing protein